MDRRRETEEEGQERQAPASPAPAVVPGLSSPQAVLAMQRGAGNAAVSALIARDPTTKDEKKQKKKSGGLSGWLRNIFGKKKKPEIKPEETKAKEKTADDARKGLVIGEAGKGEVKPGADDVKSPGTDGLKTLIDDAKEQLQVLVGLGGGDATKEDAKDTGEEQETTEAEGEEKDDELDGVGSMFDDLEKMFAEQMERDRQADEDLYAAAIGLAGFIAANPTGSMASTFAILFDDVATAWLTSPRRSLNLPGDKAKRQRLEALLEEHKWVSDADKIDTSIVEPDPKMRAKDLTRYHVAKGTKIWFLKEDGTTWDSFPIGKDFAWSELGKETLNGITGYVYTSNGKKRLIETKNIRVETGGGHQTVSGPLFPPDPEAAHVKQTTLGDCYLQAAVASLADANPGLIKAMFRDDEDAGTVTVRLYKPDHTDKANPTFTAQYVTINKSVAQDIEGKAAHNAGANWVRLLEKAYAAGGFTGSYGKAAPATKDYASIASGFSEHAMEVLTGKPSKDVTAWGKGWHGTGSEVPWGADEHKRYAEAKQPGGKYDGTLSFQILKNEADVDKWIAFTKTKDFTDVYDTFKARLTAGYASDLTIDDLKLGLDKFSEKGIADKILAHVEKAKILPGKLGSAKYSQTQLDMFRQIDAHLLKGGRVTVSSWKYPGEKKADPGVATSAGEAVHKGMVGGHAFSVLGTRSAATQDANDKAVGDYYWVKIRNPWGRYGRKYDFTKSAEEQGIAEEQGDGVSWVELSDMTRYFHSVDYG